MNNDSLSCSMEAYHAYYDHMFAPVHPAREEKRQIIFRLYGELAAGELCLQALEARFGHKFDSNQPRVPAGRHGGGRWTDGDGEDSRITHTDSIHGSASHEVLIGSGGRGVPQSWGDQRTYQKHATKHGAEFNAKSPQDYANKAKQFFKRAQQEKLPTVIDRDGVIRLYDPRTNTYGSYNRDTTTRTFFKPKQGVAYYQKEIHKVVKKGGRVLNPLPEGRRGGGIGGDSLFEDHHNIFKPVKE